MEQSQAMEQSHSQQAMEPELATVTLPNNPRILFITPEISYVSTKMSRDAERLRAKAGGLADVSALLVDGLKERGEDLHLAIPHYRHLFQSRPATANRTGEARTRGEKSVHLAEDCQFNRRGGVYHASGKDLLAASLAFQRELINHIIPDVQPDIIHCNDWMTGLIPAAAKKMGIPTLFTIHNVHTQRATLADLDQRGIAGSEFWDELYFENYPDDYEESFWFNPIDFLASGIRVADHVNVVSPSFLEEVIGGHHDSIPGHLSHLLWHKHDLGKASGIINAPDRSYNPQSDVHISENYGPDRHHQGKAANKSVLQKRAGLAEDPEAPLFFWPSRLDPTQKGCQLLAHILHDVIFHDHAHSGLQIVISADGPYQEHFHDIVRMHGLEQRVAVRGFSEDLSHLAYAASDFVLMPSSFEPCGLPQMIGCCYGSIPIAHHTGGLKDTVKPFDGSYQTGNGFVFETFDAEGLRWAIQQAMNFRQLPLEEQRAIVARVMTEAKQRFSPQSVVDDYSALYQKVLAKSK